VCGQYLKILWGIVCKESLSFVRSASDGSSACKVGRRSMRGSVLVLIITSRYLVLQMEEEKLVIIFICRLMHLIV